MSRSRRSARRASAFMPPYRRAFRLASIKDDIDTIHCQMSRYLTGSIVSAKGQEGRGMSAHFDVLIVGAGLSGIGAGHHVQKNCPDRSYAILEARDCVGGTWDLFRYPGIRSDSDMYTLGYSFRPWTEPKAIADGSSIL